MKNYIKPELEFLSLIKSDNEICTGETTVSIGYDYNEDDID